MPRITVQFELEDLPVEATADQTEEWVKYNLHERGSISCDNPLVEYDMEAAFSTVVIDAF